MNAIVLSYDKQLGFAELVYKTYMTLWPDCPFTFRIPYNHAGAVPAYLRQQDNVILIQCPQDIPGTIVGLLRGIRDDEWVYWCNDDRFPIELDPQAMSALYRHLHSGGHARLTSVKVTRWRENLAQTAFAVGGNTFRFESRPQLRGFWHHHFTRPRVLRDVLLNPSLPKAYVKPSMVHKIPPARLARTLRGTVASHKGLILFGETYLGGLGIPANAAIEMNRHGCGVPDYPILDQYVIFDDPPKQKPPKVLDPRFLVCSYGGVASRSLVRNLGHMIYGEPVANAHSHAKRPPSLPQDKRVIYLFGDPYNALMSFFRRRLSRGPRWAAAHCRNLDGDVAAFDPRWSLDEYLRNGKDLMGLEAHFDNWTRAELPYPVLLLRSETLWDHVDGLLQFLEIPLTKDHVLLPRRTRRSDWRKMPPDIQKGLHAIYGPLREKVKAFDDFKIRQPAAALAVRHSRSRRRKTFCILAQGDQVDCRWDVENKELFTTEVSDFYRLNWRQDDPNALVVAPGVSFSEGRSLLYQKVPKDYDYYIFVDDDATFHSRTGENVVRQIDRFLQEYQPISATFWRDEPWYRSLDGGSPVVPIAGFDVVAHCYSKHFADLMYPVPYHGFERTLWYAMWVCHKVHPLKQMCCLNVEVRNGAHRGPHRGTPAWRRFLARGCVVDPVASFNRHVSDNSFNWTMPVVRRLSERLQTQEVDRTPREVTESDLAKIYDVSNPGWQERRADIGAPRGDSQARAVCHVQREFRVVAPRRSGHHAVMEWIQRHADGRVCFINNIEPFRSPWDYAGEQAIRQRDVGELEYLIYNYEDCDLADVHDPTFQGRHDQMVGVSQETRHILILRDPFNNIASKWALDGFYRTQAQRHLDLFVSYAREFVGESSLLPNKICINFNRWHLDAEYRQAIARQLGIRACSRPYLKVPRPGSSFSGYEYDGRAGKMNVTQRWKEYRNQPDFRSLFRRNREARRLSRKIFGKISMPLGRWLARL